MENLTFNEKYGRLLNDGTPPGGGSPSRLLRIH